MFKNNKVEISLEASSSVEAKHKIMHLTDRQAEIISIEMRDIK